MNAGSLMMVVVFVTGFLLGALMVSMHRAATLDRIRREFEEQLHAVLREEAERHESAPPTSAALNLGRQELPAQKAATAAGQGC